MNPIQQHIPLPQHHRHQGDGDGDGDGKVCFVLIHGLHGRASNLHYLRKRVEERFGDGAVVMIPTCNEGRFLTHDGIENGAKRITQYVKIELKKHRDVRRLSIIGHS